MDVLSADVAIVGGGPAGACAAIRLADLGHRVVLLERERFPRAHVGEALSPGVEVQLAGLGLGGLAERLGALRFDSSAVRWGEADWRSRPAHPGSATVDRASFDSALLREAARRGAMLLQSARARTCLRTPSGWRIEAESEGGVRIAECRFLIDASGRSGLLRRRRIRGTAPTFAVHAYWTGRVPVRPAVAAGADHWIWASPVPGLGCSVMVFLDRDGLAGRRRDIDRSYRADVAAAGLLAGPAAAGPARVCDASAYEEEEVGGPDWLRIGEAAFALDPISSSGVQKAVATALTGAIVANTILRRPGDSVLALDFHRSEQERTTRRHRAWAGAVYGENLLHSGEAFWSERSAAADPAPATRPDRPLDAGESLYLAPGARFEEVATIGPEYVEARPGIVYPAAERPVAYVGDTLLAPLLRDLPARAGALAERLAGPAPLRSLERLVELGILSRAPCRSLDSAL